MRRTCQCSGLQARVTGHAASASASRKYGFIAASSSGGPNATTGLAHHCEAPGLALDRPRDDANATIAIRPSVASTWATGALSPHMASAYACAVVHPETFARRAAPFTRRLHLMRAAIWALHAGLVARRDLRRMSVTSIGLPRLPRLAREAGPAVDAVLRWTRRTCQERSLVRQPWLAAQGVPRDLVIGIKAGRPFAAHAWLEGDPPASSSGFQELSRHPARDVRVP